MLKRLFYYFAYLLMLLMPLQGIAAANLSVCNSLMQSNANPANTMAKSAMGDHCQMHMAQMAKGNPCHNEDKHGNPYKSNCTALCLSMSAFTTLPNVMQTPVPEASMLITEASFTSYVSITHTNLLRPPIFLS